MVDRTQEDINQDARIAHLEQEMRVLNSMLTDLSVDVQRHGVAIHQHANRLSVLDPLAALVEHVEHIVEFFKHWKEVFAK